MLPLKGFAKEGEKRGQKRFLAVLEMTAWGMEIPCIIQRMCGKSVLLVSSSRAKSRDLFRLRWVRKNEDSGQRETRYSRRVGITVFHGEEASPPHCHFERKREIFFVCGRSGKREDSGSRETPYIKRQEIMVLHPTEGASPQREPLSSLLPEELRENLIKPIYSFKKRKTNAIHGFNIARHSIVR